MIYGTYIEAGQRHRLYSLAMMLLLLWLTVSVPFVYERQIEVAAMDGACDDAETSDPFAGTTEEKTEGGINSLSEYIHEVHHSLPSFNAVAVVYKCHPDDLYFSFHPDLFSPPPESAI